LFKMIRFMINFLVKLGFERSASVCASLAASYRSRLKILLRYRDGAWIHYCPDYVVVFSDWCSTPLTVTEGAHHIFFRRYVPKLGDAVVDIGAGSGTEVIVLSKMVGDGGVVVAVEANPTVFLRLLKTIKLNNLKNVIPINLAVCGSSGITSLYSDPDADIEEVTGSIVTSEGAGVINVLAVSLSSLLKLLKLDRIDYLKMNIEGSEGEVFLGFDNEYKRIVNWCVSCHDFMGRDSLRTYDSVVDSFKSAGLNPFSSSEGRLSDPSRYYVYASQTAD